MIQSHAAISDARDSATAGQSLGREIREALGGPASAIIVFASAQHDGPALLEALRAESGCSVLVGASSAGEFTHGTSGEGWASALALRSDTMRFSTGLGLGVSTDPTGAARSVVRGFQDSLARRPLPHRAALVMTDALAGHADQVVEELTVATGGNYTFFGGGAGDDGQFVKTFVFCGTKTFSDAVVALEIQSDAAIGVGVSHGWLPTERGYRVTEVEGGRLISLNGAPAMDAFVEHAEKTGQVIETTNPLPFFLHNILGIRGNGGYRLRVPLAVHADGSVSCAAGIPLGSVVHIMKTDVQSAVQAARHATKAALAALGSRRPQAALVFDCVATRLRLGSGFDDELQACAELLAPAHFVGCNTYGQIARAQGQFGGFHNCTAVVCVFPE
ncbi:MAG: FIST N-terminal domain-containing protein [Pseudomonadota bacterium]